MRNEGYGNMRHSQDEACSAVLPVMAFVPVQELECVYEPEHGFCRGTIFPELDKPWLPGKGGNCCG